MNIAIRKARTGVALLASAGLVMGLVGTQSAFAESRATATEGVNIRSGPGTTYKVVGGLYRGQSITALATLSGWTKIRFNGTTAYISSRYLVTGSKAPAAPVQIGTTGTKITTATLNVRNGPGLSSPVVATINEGSQVTLTGKSSRGFTEISYGGARRWVTSQYLASSSNGLPTITGTRIATADLLVRTTSGTDFAVITEVKKGTRLSVTGATQNGRAQIVYQNAVRWVTAQYLSNQASSQPSSPAAPVSKGARYATADLLIRTTAASNASVITTVPKGSSLQITGVTQGGYAQVIYGKAVRWVTAQYLSTQKPSSSGSSGSGYGGSGLTNLQPQTKNLLNNLNTAFPEIKTFYGVRPDSIPDHPSGLALDSMLPNYSSAPGKALGDRIANWAKTNQQSLNIEYIIWNQRIWNVRRAGEGWRSMADRGSTTANHKDHVHITVLS